MRYFNKKFLCVIGMFVAGCGKEEKPAQIAVPQSMGSKESTIQKNADKYKINDKALKAAASISSNFGTKVEDIKKTTGEDRANTFGLNDVTISTNKGSFEQNTEKMAATIAAYAKQTKPTQLFDWFLITAQAIVGKEPITELAAIKIKIVLNELISRYQNGYTATFDDKEVIFEAPATEPIRLDLLDPIRSKYLNLSALDNEFGVQWPGSTEAEIGEKYGYEMPKIILRWCSSSALACFESIRNSIEYPSHYVAYRSANNGLEFAKIHANRKDLGWYGGLAHNAISITLTGIADGNGFEPELLKWSDYVAIHGLISNILQSYANSTSSDTLDSNFNNYVALENGISPVLTSLSAVPEGKPTFAIPSLWDKDLFADLLHYKSHEKESAVERKDQAKLVDVKGRHVSFEFTARPSAASVAIYGSTDKGWEFLRQSAVVGSTYRFEDDLISVNASENPFSALRVIAKNKQGQPVGMSTFRYRLK